MSLSEILPAVHALSAADKRLLSRLLTDDLAQTPSPDGATSPTQVNPPAHLTPAEAMAWRGERMAAALDKLAALNAFSDIKDPAAWEREIRQDRPLLGRE